MSKPFYSPREIDEIRNDPGALLWELHQAAAYGDAGRVRECLDAGADVNGRNPDFGSTALMLAAAGNYREIANLLLERGARIDIADHGGRTAETWADERHNEELADFLRSRRPLGGRCLHAAGAALGLLKAYGPQTPAQVRALGIGGLGARFGRSWHGETYRVAGGIPLCFDLWRPVGPDNKLPLVVLVHGGGWNGGSRSDASVSGMGNTLLAHGFAVATVDYRVAWDERFPGFRFPDPLCDVKAAVRHFRAHAEEFGIDPSRIGAFGHSAGAHLALLLGLTSAHPVLEKDSGDTAVSSAVRAVCGISCPCDFQTLVEVAKLLRAAVDTDDPGKRRTLLSGLSGRSDLAVILETMNVHDFPLAQRDLSDKATAMLWERKFNWSRPVLLARGLVHAEAETLDALLAREKELLLASPLTHARRPAVAGPLPSFLLLHGGKDSLIPAEGCRLFGDALRGHGADCDVRIDPDAGHWHRDAYRLVPEFFRRTL
ncbi:MAG: alpha/beta fold hydrolase [Kiritimatiellae bacterium]|nr:alpha/beta fold hydrolase [Kiritimatiellia bacterium]